MIRLSSNTAASWGRERVVRAVRATWPPRIDLMVEVIPCRVNVGRKTPGFLAQELLLDPIMIRSLGYPPPPIDEKHVASRTNEFLLQVCISLGVGLHELEEGVLGEPEPLFCINSPVAFLTDPSRKGTPKTVISGYDENPSGDVWLVRS